MLSLSRNLATRLLTHAQSSPDARVCGLLLSRDGAPDRVVPLRNVAASPDSAHAFDRSEFDLAVRNAHSENLAPLAVYHSHPQSPPVPSSADVQARPQADLSVLVISLDTKGVLEMRAFIPHGDSVQETPVQIFL